MENMNYNNENEKCLNGEVAVEDKEMTANRVNCLLPEDELHVFTPYNCETVLRNTSSFHVESHLWRFADMKIELHTPML